MKISVITWDASFREKFHTIDTYCQQNFPTHEFEFIWVDFYCNSNPALLDCISKYSNAKLLNLNHAKDVKWHVGKCLNAGVKASKGNILVLPDGDIIANKDQLQVISDELQSRADLILYFRRWDEMEESHCSSSCDIKYLQKNTTIVNPTNYGGCLAMNRRNWVSIYGYEEHDIFAGAGAIGMETYLRLRNAGFAIRWHPQEIFHPWHHSTGSSDKMTDELKEIAKYVDWLKPYCGIKQSWALRSREFDLSYKANDGKLDFYCQTAPTLEELRRALPRRRKSLRQLLSLKI